MHPAAPAFSETRTETFFQDIGYRPMPSVRPRRQIRRSAWWLVLGPAAGAAFVGLLHGLFC